MAGATPPTTHSTNTHDVLKTMKTLVLSTTVILLFQSAKASFYIPKGVTSLTHPAFNPPHRPKQTKNKRRSKTSTVNMDKTTDQNDTTIPPLRSLGDKQLLQQQPPVTQKQLHSNEFQNNLKMLPNAMNKYGGIGIAAPQVGWWRPVSFASEWMAPIQDIPTRAITLFP